MEISKIKIITGLAIIILSGLILFLLFYVRSQYLLKEGKKPLETTPLSISEKVDIPYTENSFALDYKNFDTSLVENISLVNSSDSWTGSGFSDNRLYFEYPQSLLLAGSDKIIAQKELKLDLGKTDNFELILILKSDQNDLEVSQLIFTDENSRTAQFITPTFFSTWQITKFAKKDFISSQFDWSKVRKVNLEFVPRPWGKVVVNLAGLRIYADDALDKDWNFSDKNYLILDKRHDKVNLMFRNIGQQPAGVTIKKITSSADFSFQSSFSPLSETWGGLFFRGNYANGYGYYLMVNGIGGSQWQVYKINKSGLKVIKRDIIPDFQFKFGQWYKLKVETKGNIFSIYLSSDGGQFKLLGEVTDGEFAAGGVGLAMGNGSVGLYNDFVFEK